VEVFECGWRGLLSLAKGMRRMMRIAVWRKGKNFWKRRESVDSD